jgi:hypothetical protein
MGIMRALFQTCKQISSECARFFYGENVFAFSTHEFVPYGNNSKDPRLGFLFFSMVMFKNTRDSQLIFEGKRMAALAALLTH